MTLRLMSAIGSTTISLHGRQADSGLLLRQLLECVQDCQKRFGGKKELATEFDSCVAGLCLSLEAVFLHGLRSKPLESQNTSTLKQVSDIVTNSLHIGQETCSFWPVINKHLTKHEQERYTVLKHIWTDTGRGKAWIRSALNERSLERYIIRITADQDLLNTYYEPWGLLRDQEKSSLLPNMAAGLGSILFAVSIDKPELNSGIPHRNDHLISKAEPIIEAPLPEQKDTKHRKKKKVARQFISFDDDDSLLSTSLPSSSSSMSSDTNSIGETKPPAPKEPLNQIVEEVKVDLEPQKQEINRKLSFENSGTRRKYSTEVPETLTPVSQQVEIGELTPVSVELNKHFDSPDSSDDILEVPTDISAVLIAVEKKNQEELVKRQEKIDLLVRENEGLKEQVKKYVGAIQMLRRDDESMQKALDGLQIEPQPDYRGEAKIYEQKLVQVAEMHAELMDFNVMLQQSLCKKDSLLERLKTELELLRGPTLTDESDEDVRSSVNVWIPSAFLTGSGSSSHHVYQIFLKAGNDEWNIYRRYAQFYALHSDLKKLDPVVATYDFPPKKSLGKKDSALVEERRKRLQIYLRRVLAHWPELAHCNSRFLLEQHLAFFKEVKDDAKKKGNTSSRRSNPTNDNHYTGL